MAWFTRLRNVFRSNKVSEDIDREVSFHLAERTDDLVATGMPREAARREARRRFGNDTLQKERTRDHDLLVSLETAIADVRYSFRTLRAAPGFTVVAVGSLALGIGANTAVFSVVNALLLKPLDVADPAALVSLVRVTPGSESPSLYFSYRELERLRERCRSFSGLFGYQAEFRPHMKLPGGGTDARGEPVQAPMVTSGFFSTLGVHAVLGRTFADVDDAVAEPESGVVLSDEFWRRRFARDPRVLGRPIVVVRDYPFTIIGVARPGFSGIDVGHRPDMWVPLGALKRMDLERLMDSQITVMGRLRPGVTREAARAEAAVVFSGILQERADARPDWGSARRRAFLDQRIDVQPGGTGQTENLRIRFRDPLLLLMASVAAVLLIASVNVAGLLVARGAARRRELAVRLALGSGGMRLMRQLLTENAALAVLAVMAGLAVARFGIPLLLSHAPADAAIALNTSVDRRVLAFTIAAMVVSTVVFGLLPAWRATAIDLNTVLKSGPTRMTMGALPLQRLLVTAQIALTVVLLVSAGLVFRTLQNLRNADTGFDRRHVLVFQVNGGAVRPDVARRVLVPRLAAIPGVESAAFFANLGLLGGNSVQTECKVDSEPPQSMDQSCEYMSVGLRFFETMGIALLQGRAFRADDERSSPTVAVINEEMARYYFRRENPIGRRINGKEIVGVVKNTTYTSLREPTQRIFYTLVGAGLPIADVRFAVRAGAAGAGLGNAIRAAVQEVVPSPITQMETPDDRVEATLLRERLLVRFAGGFSMLALLLACIGVYGALSYAVAQRTHDIGVRMALGARAPDIVTMMLKETAVMVAAGLVLGLAAGIATARLFATLLFGLNPTDPATMAGVVFVLAGAAAVAAYLPARRASRVDPMVALRQA